MGDILFDIVGCFVIGNIMFGTTAGGDSDDLACAELELEVSSLFLGDVGDWLYKSKLQLNLHTVGKIKIILNLK